MNAEPEHRPGLVRRFLAANYAISESIERRLPRRYTRSAHDAFDNDLLPTYLAAGQTVYVLGGGEDPQVDLATKQRLGLTLVGLDISAEQMAKAPAGVYDREIEADVSTYVGEGDGDVVIFRTVLEHIADVDGAFRAIASVLKPGGRAILLVPCANALFARLNMVLPEPIKRRALAATHGERDEGYPAYYRKCTPKGVNELATRHGLQTVEIVPFYFSDYFYYLVPAYLLWRAWSLAGSVVVRGEACEVFSAVLQRAPERVAKAPQSVDATVG